MSRGEQILRRLLWVRHGCPPHGLYGDDGEMQCGICGLDFVRDSAERIEQKIRELGMARLARYNEMEDVIRKDKDVEWGWVLCRYPHGIVLNPMEYVLSDDSKQVLFFDTPGQALDFFIDNGGYLGDIGNGVYIEREIKSINKEEKNVE